MHWSAFSALILLIRSSSSSTCSSRSHVSDSQRCNTGANSGAARVVLTAVLCTTEDRCMADVTLGAVDAEMTWLPLVLVRGPISASRVHLYTR